MSNLFDVKIEKQYDIFSGNTYFVRITHNGCQWNSILLSLGELEKIEEAIHKFISENKDIS